ncbi:ArsR/SmtB family transcription factor [Streptomyces armeniacus]|uniref:ArsR/SmtB family transcription factor n=1 Tax=Streptomyces armeniacus TaxID=83291 RepID=UPI001FE2F42B|nr:metalloregulator ArsR/SmtB family transcription factor [Streptomyces armeniacus]
MSQLPAPAEEPGPQQLDAVAGALADPIRRKILDILRTGPHSAGGIAGQFTVSRPAISRHLRVLRESGLVRDEPVGRQRLYALDVSRFAGLEEWIGRFTRPSGWEHRLDALGTEVHRTRRERERERERERGRDRERAAGAAGSGTTRGDTAVQHSKEEPA